MDLLKFVPIKLTLFLVLGILIGDKFNFPLSYSLALTILSILKLGYLFTTSKNRKSVSFGVAMIVATISMGILSINLWQPKNWSSHYSYQSKKEGTTLKLKIREVLKPNSYSERYVALVNEIDGKKASGKIILTAPIDSTKRTFQVDNELFVHGILSEVQTPLNPHQFDYREYLETLGIYHELKTEKDALYLSKKYSWSIYGIAATARNKIIDKLKSANFGKEELAIIQALLLGQRNDITTETFDDYKDAGAVHILAVSGLHIGILLLLLQFALRPLELLPNGKILKLVVIVILLWGFAFLAGLSASIVRAVTMFSFVAYALYLNRPSNTFNILALSMFFILLVINPKLLFQVGFQMSYAAVFAIVWIYPLFQRFWSPKNSFLRKIWQLFSVSVAAQLGVLPISLFYFHQFPGLFFVSNLLIVPALGVILGTGILVIALALFNVLPSFLVSIYNSMIGWMNAIVKWVAKQESFVFDQISFDAVQLFLAYTLLISLVLCFSKGTFKRALVFGFAIIVFQVYFFQTIYQTSKKSDLLLAHQSKNTVLLNQKGEKLYRFTTDSLRSARLINDYIVGERIAFVQDLSLKNSYETKYGSLYIMDSLSIYPPTKKRIDYLVLTQSPKINLNRLIDSVLPRQILVDGSNYKSYIKRWQATCDKRKIPFHYTGEKGAFYFNR